MQSVIETRDRLQVELEHVRQELEATQQEIERIVEPKRVESQKAFQERVRGKDSVDNVQRRDCGCYTYETARESSAGVYPSEQERLYCEKHSHPALKFISLPNTDPPQELAAQQKRLQAVADSLSKQINEHNVALQVLKALSPQ